MGCAPCQAKAATQAAMTKTQATKQTVNSDECPFTIEQVSIWLDKVKCILSQGFYTQIQHITKKQLNSYVGILLSAKNYADRPCYFEKELEEIESFITFLIAMNLCSS